MVYLPRILEFIQYCMLENPNAGIQQMLQAVVDGIELRVFNSSIG